MGNLEVEKDRLGFDSKRYTTLLFVCSIALPVSLMIIIMYQNQLFDLTGGLAKPAKSRNVTALNVDSKNDSSPPAIIPDGRLHNGNLPPGFGNGTSSENNSSRHTNGTDKQLNGTMAPGFWIESGSRNDSSGNDTRPKNNSLPNTSGPDEKQLNGTSAPGFRKESGSRNYSENDSLLNTSRPNVKHRNETLAPGFQKESGSRNDPSQSNIMPGDKFLDGLLAPGFDERSCSSRYQSFLFRKTSLHKPSSHLLSKLRRYEDIHKRCGPHSKSYHKALKGLRSSHASRGGCKYVVWIPANGLGNRMLSMAATFLYALLTNRVLLVKHGADMANLFCEPFPNTSWLLPNDFPLRNHFGSSKHRYAHSFGRMINKSITNTSMEPPESYLDLNLALGGYDQLAFCDESQALLQQIPWLILLSDQYFVPSLYMIPSFNQEIRKLFPEKETVFYHLGHYLFHPSNQVWGLITRFYQAYLAKADERIGLQIRVYHDKTTPYQTVMDQILDCVLKEKLLPEVADTQEPTPPPSRNQTSKAILITSLYSEYYENMKNMYWTKPTVTGEVISVYQPSHEEYQHFGDDKHNMKAWADIYLLSLCDVLVTSTWSTFGYVAHGLAGLKPWIWQMPRNKNPACQRAMSMEPCCHFPLTYDCKTRIEVSAATLLPNTMHCEDRKNGLKLVDEHGELLL
ncbi:2-ALPHA-L-FUCOSYLTRANSFERASE putative-RELATED [Salix koriyanagi]|uniref:2-ALPHA-L-FUCOSYLTRANSFERASE putative-RELATED n=1 Tax=Salix koriyanagi TaxID=2511006 RepID=A0A9Q0Q9C9_9ROSI|nr:2-ALPHA-L-FUCOSYLTRANSFERASE putative-RELATED [Salix koriyanagi]